MTKVQPMGETNKRPADFRLGQGLQNSTITVPSAKCHPKTTGNERGTKTNCIQRGSKHVGDECYSKSKTCKRGNNKPHFQKKREKKEKGQYRPIAILKPLNVFVPHQKFKMETLKT